MKPSEAPRGTLASTGHPANHRWVVKGRDGWRHIDTGELCTEDEFRGGWILISLPIDNT